MFNHGVHVYFRINSSLPLFNRYAGSSFTLVYIHAMTRDSPAGIATRYGLDGPGIKSRCGKDFPPPYRTALGAIQTPVHWVTGLSWG